jgi:hypothetical protein
MLVSAAAGHVATTTLLADMQTFPLPDVLEDLLSLANLRYQARSLLAQNGQNFGGIGTLSLSVRVANHSLVVGSSSPSSPAYQQGKINRLSEL